MLCKQPNGWTCYPTCVSYLTGIPFDALLSTIGHDGSRVIQPERMEPACRESFTYSEMAIALLQHGWFTTAIYAALEHENGEPISAYPSFQVIEGLIANVCDRVIVTAASKTKGIDHCFAWTPSKNELIDPLTGQNINFLDESRPVKHFELLLRKAGNEGG